MTARASWGFAPGDRISERLIAHDKLGGGRRFETYTAWDERLFVVIVVKLLRPDLVEDEASLRSLAAEAQIVERLSHPVIVRSFGARLNGPRPHLVLEHLEGPTLAHLLKRYGALPLEQLIPLALQVCAALHYLEEEEVVHLDVKPRNIIMGAPPRLIDLSIARSFDRARRTLDPIGTDPYMAPEQCEPRGRGRMGAPADIWGLGASLYHAAAGRRPFVRSKDFDRDDPAARWPQLEKDPPPLLREVPPPLAELVSSCLQKDPSLRPTASEVVHSLEPLVAALPRRRVFGRLRPRLR
ncbi:MAG: serine/threonine-protein kinase [Actinomycetota bacterium]